MRIFLIEKRFLPDLADELFLEAHDKLIGNLLSHGNLVDIDADLAAVAKLEECDLSGRIP